MGSMNDFVIQDGVLTEYRGSEAHVVIPDGVTAIGERVFFFREDIKSVVVPEGVTEIGADAFGFCRLDELFLPSTLQTMDGSAFSGFSHVSKLHLADIGAWCRMAVVIEIGSFDNPMSGAELYENGELVTHLVIPEDVSTVYENRFHGCRSIQTVTISGNTSHLYSSAFAYCTNLTTVRMAEGCEYVGTMAFYQCENLETCDLPSTVTVIGEAAFKGCKKLRRVETSTTTILRNAFAGCESLVTATVGGTSEGIFSGCTSLKSVTILGGE